MGGSALRRAAHTRQRPSVAGRPPFHHRWLLRIQLFANCADRATSSSQTLPMERGEHMTGVRIGWRLWRHVRGLASQNWGTHALGVLSHF